MTTTATIEQAATAIAQGLRRVTRTFIRVYHGYALTAPDALQQEIAKAAGVSEASVTKFLPLVTSAAPGLADFRPMRMPPVLDVTKIDKIGVSQLPEFWPAGGACEMDFLARDERTAAAFDHVVNSVFDNEPKGEKGEKIEAKVETKSKGDRAQALAELLEIIAQPQAVEVDINIDTIRETVKQEVAAAIAAAGVGTITVKFNGAEDVVTSTVGKHAEFERVLRIVNALGIVALVGPAGSGKSTICGQVAEALKLDFYAYSCTQGMSEGQLTGRLGFGNEYLPAPFVELYENGGLVLLDEFDALNDNVRLVLNNAIANGYMSVPNRVENPIAKRHENFRVAFGMNTFGFGATGEYTGRDTVDAATRDRFDMAKVEVNYDPELEAGIEGLGDWKPVEVKADAIEVPRLKVTLGQALENIRAAIAQNNVKGVRMSTRSKVNAAKLKASGFSDEEILDIYFTGWTPRQFQQVADSINRKAA